MALVGASLNAATTTGPGAAIIFDVPKFYTTMQVIVTGSPTVCTGIMEFTFDGITWFPYTTTLDFTITTKFLNSGETIAGIRANLTALSGGTSPTVTAWIAAS